MSDIVERLTANLDKYPGFQNMNSEASAEITRLREENVRLHDEIGAIRQEAAVAPVIAQHNETIKAMSRAADVLAESLDNADEIASLRARLAAWKAEAEAARARLTSLGHAYVTVGPEVPWHPNLAAYAKARAATDAIEKEPQ